MVDDHIKRHRDWNKMLPIDKLSTPAKSDGSGPVLGGAKVAIKTNFRQFLGAPARACCVPSFITLLFQI